MHLLLPISFIDSLHVQSNQVYIQVVDSSQGFASHAQSIMVVLAYLDFVWFCMYRAMPPSVQITLWSATFGCSRNPDLSTYKFIENICGKAAPDLTPGSYVPVEVSSY